ncbi:hypothetical protein MUK42_29554 [Musa troglodytarum]|uniref:RING-type domain-containing protein n=1 Tax=Musa troglodytarum TaxID=320322 RepID=A0A9E7JWG8_9LILI|nr:hypothetical protein MUK42_29554 [Musa troglodytarum]
MSGLCVFCEGGAMKPRHSWRSVAGMSPSLAAVVLHPQGAAPRAPPHSAALYESNSPVCPLHDPLPSPPPHTKLISLSLMEVEARHAHLVRSQLLTNSEIIGSGADQPGAHGLRVGIVAPAADAAVAAAASRKRPRAPSFLGGDGLCYLQQQMLDFDRLVLQHVSDGLELAWQAESVRAGLAVRRHRFARWVVAALEAGVLERLKAREEEIARVGERNWGLEERIRRLRVENQVWRDLAQSSEATANVLRANLEHALAAAQVRAEEEEEATADNAEGEAAVGRGRGTACRSCREREPSVLLLPCRHLCLCAACGPVVDACPVCSCTKNGSVQVNMSRVREKRVEPLLPSSREEVWMCHPRVGYAPCTRGWWPHPEATMNGAWRRLERSKSCSCDRAQDLILALLLLCLK